MNVRNRDQPILALLSYAHKARTWRLKDVRGKVIQAMFELTCSNCWFQPCLPRRPTTLNRLLIRLERDVLGIAVGKVIHILPRMLRANTIFFTLLKYS